MHGHNLSLSLSHSLTLSLPPPPLPSPPPSLSLPPSQEFSHRHELDAYLSANGLLAPSSPSPSRPPAAIPACDLDSPAQPNPLAAPLASGRQLASASASASASARVRSRAAEQQQRQQQQQQQGPLAGPFFVSLPREGEGGRGLDYDGEEGGGRNADGCGRAEGEGRAESPSLRTLVAAQDERVLAWLRGRVRGGFDEERFGGQIGFGRLIAFLEGEVHAQ